MTIVSDTSPLCYLSLIGQVELLPKLYGSVHITQKVLDELRRPDAPSAVRDWAEKPPDWLHVHCDPEEPDQTFSTLDPGERTALRLAEKLHSEVLLLDEAAGRAFAVQRGLKVSGTLGVLCDGAQAGLLKLSDALDLLRKTNFSASPELWKPLYTKYKGDQIKAWPSLRNCSTIGLSTLSSATSIMPPR